MNINERTPGSFSLDSLQERATVSPITQVHHRLDPDQYLALAKQCDRPFVSEVTTPLQAGYQLGVQAVLKLLREGWVTQ